MNQGRAHWLIFIVIILGVSGAFFGYKTAMKSENKIFKRRRSKKPRLHGQHHSRYENESG